MLKASYSIEFLLSFAIYILFIGMLAIVILHIKSQVQSLSFVEHVNAIIASQKMDIYLINNCLPSANKWEEFSLFSLGDNTYLINKEGKMISITMLGVKAENACT